MSKKVFSANDLYSYAMAEDSRQHQEYGYPDSLWDVIDEGSEAAENYDKLNEDEKEEFISRLREVAPSLHDEFVELGNLNAGDFNSEEEFMEERNRIQNSISGYLINEIGEFLQDDDQGGI